MITEFILNLLCFLPNSLLDNLENVSIEIPADIFEGLNSIFSCLGFMFPIAGLMLILLVSFSIKAFQIIWALVIRIKSFIPSMGS